MAKNVLLRDNLWEILYGDDDNIENIIDMLKERAIKKDINSAIALGLFMIADSNQFIADKLHDINKSVQNLSFMEDLTVDTSEIATSIVDLSTEISTNIENISDKLDILNENIENLNKK